MSSREPVSRRTRPAKAPLSRAAIVDAALRVLERDGGSKLTMRRVAAELDTGPASLYVYVRNTTGLHALLIDRLLASLDLAWDGAEPWRERLHRVLADYRGLLAERPEIARGALSVWPDGPNYLDLVELLLRLLAAAGVDQRAAAWAVDLLLQHVSAAAAEWAERAADAGQDLDDLSATLASADPRRHPVLASFDTALLTAGDPEIRDRWAVDVLIDGVLARSAPAGA